MAKSIATRTESILDQSAAAGIAVDRMSEAELERRWPFLRLPPLPGGVEGLHEPRLAGCLSPRRLVAAQLLMTQRAGGSVARGTVTEVTVGRPSKTRRLRVQQNGREAEIRARRVLIAAGAFTNHNGLLPPESRLAMHTFTEPNLLLELDARDAERLQSMPPVITVDPEDTGLGNLSGYLLPPMRSADGRWYLRIGPGMQPIVRQLDSLDEMRAWYIRQQITKEQRAFLTSMWQKLLPDVKPLSVRAACCIIEKTPSRYFYVGQVGNDEGLHVAVGGNGHGARGSDEIGRLAAVLLTSGAWDFPVAPEVFAPMMASSAGNAETHEGFLRPPFGLC
jgi:sarcosine oxidase